MIREITTLVATLVITTLFVLSAAPSFAKQRQDLRLYRVNKDGISDRFWFTRGAAKKPGCHNLRKKSRLHSAVQFGYGVCRIYKKKNCQADTVLTFVRDDDVPATSELTQGYRWYTVSTHSRGERVKSWFCGEAQQQ